MEKMGLKYYALYFVCAWVCVCVCVLLVSCSKKYLPPGKVTFAKKHNAWNMLLASFPVDRHCQAGLIQKALASPVTIR